MLDDDEANRFNMLQIWVGVMITLQNIQNEALNMSPQHRAELVERLLGVSRRPTMKFWLTGQSRETTTGSIRIRRGDRHGR